MGCNQSTQRKDESKNAQEKQNVQQQPAAAPVATSAPKQAEPVAEPQVGEAAPVEARAEAPAAAPEVVAPIQAEQTETPVEPKQEEPMPAETTTELEAPKADEKTITEEVDARIEEIGQPAHSADEVPVVVSAPVEHTIVAPVAEAPEAKKESTTPVMPPLALNKTEENTQARRAPRSKTPAKTAPKAASRNMTPRKENVSKAGAKTPSKTTPVKKNALGEAKVNSAAQQRKVVFDPVPAQPTKSEKSKARAKKIGGKHSCNVQEDMFLASIAAFERQLTHRSSLDSQLNTR